MNTYDWSSFRKSPIHQEIISKWENLLDNKQLKELDYHNFLKLHPAIFLTPYECYLAISKLKLGSEYETDFTLVKEGYSDGTKYDVIEIESPHTELFDSTGKPTSKLNSALQQIRDWKRFLTHDKTAFKKIFPTSSTRVINDSRLKFKIIIGRRTTNKEHLEKRRQIMETDGIEIFSFDRITDMAKNRIMFFNEAAIHAAQMLYIPFEKKNELANPFFECTTDSAWRKICKKGDSHIYSNLIDDILRIRKYNPYFDEYIKSLPA